MPQTFRCELWAQLLWHVQLYLIGETTDSYCLDYPSYTFQFFELGRYSEDTRFKDK